MICIVQENEASPILVGKMLKLSYFILIFVLCVVFSVRVNGRAQATGQGCAKIPKRSKIQDP